MSERTASPIEDRVLIFAPTANDAVLTRDFLESAGVRGDICANVSELCAKVREGCAALLLSEETLANDAMDPLVAELSRQPPWSDLPITLITSGGEASRARLRRLAVFGPGGNVSLLERPFRPETLISVVDVALRARRRQRDVRELVHELKAGEERLQGILDSISDAFISIDREWRIIYVNPCYRKLVAPLVGSQDDLIGQNLWERFPEIRGTEIERFYRRMMAANRPETLEVFHERLQAWLEVRASPSGGGLSLYIQDVTERRRAERALRHLAAIVESSDDAIVSKDLQGVIQSWNAGAQQLFGYTAEEIVGRPVTVLIPPERHDEEPGILARICRGEPVDHYETIRRRKDGSEVMVSLTVSPIRDRDGRIVGASKIARDITEQKRTERALKEAKDAAEAANHSKDRFLAVLSHELRTPLTPVLMTASALEMDPEVPANLRADMAMIRRNVELETKLIDDLLDLSRITTGKLSLHMRVIAINEAVRQVCAICEQEIAEKGLRLDIDLEPDAGQVCADPARLQQILWNILKNAAKFTARGGVIRVSTARQPGDRVRIVIRDSGIGIAPGMLPKIFDAFEQGDAEITRHFGGLGLGLAITKALVELHKGAIRAESAGAGLGSTFSIELPLSVGEHSAEGLDGPASPRGQSLRLLLVEDHADTAAMLTKVLQGMGYQVTMANTAGAALEFSEQQDFDVVVSDIGLPDITGYEFMRRLQARHGIPGIAMSGYGMEEDLRRSLESGFSEHLVKPVSLSSLEQAIRRLACK